MGAKTPFTADALRGILASYDLGELLDFEPFVHGADGTNIKLDTSAGPFAFRYYEKRSTEYVLFEIDLLQYLTRCGYPCPTPVTNRGGDPVGHYKDKPYALFTFLQGHHDMSVSRARSVAREIGRLHTLTKNRRPAYADVRAPYDRDYCVSCATESAKTMQPVEAERRLGWLTRELDAVQLPSSLPRGICHCDPNPSNFLYNKNGVSAVLDFDQAGGTVLLYDVAELVYWWAWSNRGEINIAIAREVLAGYEETRQLTTSERKHLYDALIMVNLVACAWFLAHDDFINDRERIELLTSLGRKEFYRLIFS